MTRASPAPAPRPEPARAAPVSKLELLLVVLLAFVPYASVLDGPFLYDDRAYVIENYQVTDASHTLECLRSSYPPGSATQALYRPLVTLSYALDHALAGLDPRLFHLTNVLLHVAASLAVFALVRAWIPEVAGWSAMLFAVHPVHAEAVSWIVGRAELLCGLGVFLALWLAPRRWALASALCFLALLSKEMAIAAPLLVLLPVAFLGVPPARIRPAFVGFTLALFLYLGIRAGVLGWLTPQGEKQFLEGTSLLARLPALCTAYFEYLRLALLPVGLAVEHPWSTVPTWSTPQAGLGLVALVGLGALAWSLRRRQAWLAVAVGWFVLALVPVSHLFPIGASYAERFLYLPSLGTCVAVAALLARIPSRRVAQGAFLALVLTWGTLTLVRNQVWRDEERFYQAAIAAAPGNATLRNNLGRLYADRKEFARAEALFQEALERTPDHPPALCNLGVMRAMNGRLAEAEELLEHALRVDPGYARAHCNLGKVRALSGRSDEARRSFERTLELNPAYEEARTELERLGQPSR